MKYKEHSCLDRLIKQVNSVPKFSQNWYKLMSYRLDYYYDRQLFKDIKSTIEPLLEISKKPEVFETQLYFYYAKALINLGDKELAEHYAELSINKLERIYHVFEEPLRMVEIANLRFVFGDAQKAYKLLLLAENKFAERNDATFHFELNGNKGHVHFKWQDYKRAARYYKQSLNWVINTKQDTKKIVAYLNVARANQFMHENDIALKYYGEAESLLLTKESPKLMTLMLFRVAKTYEQKNDLVSAKAYLNRIDIKHLHRVTLPDYHRLLKKIKHSL